MRTLLIVAVVSWSAAARAADLAECTEALAECREDCTMAFGTSMADATRRKLSGCLTKCASKDTDCRERVAELTNNQLDDSAIARQPGDDEARGAPAAKANRADDAQPPARREGDVRLEDAQAQAPKPIQQKQDLRDDEVPKSTRTQVKVEQKPAPLAVPAGDAKAEPSVAPAAAVKVQPAAAPKPAPVEAPKKTEPKRRPLDEWDPDAP